MNQKLPKVLILSRGVWDDSKGTSSTLTNLFEDYETDKLAHIYIETTPPNTKCCHCFFQISEFSLVHKLFKWKTKTGHVIDTREEDLGKVDDQIALQEAKTMSYVRSHRLLLFSIMRELLWLFNGWKSKDLKQFIVDTNPDVIWMDGSPLPLMNRLYDYVLKEAKRPAVLFIQDDIYTYESCGTSFWAKVQKIRLRRTVRRVISQCNHLFLISPKMKREYDEIFKVDSTVITKGIDMTKVSIPSEKTHQPIRLVYMGQVIYGRIYSLIAIAEALRRINIEHVKIQLRIYTSNEIDENMRQKLFVKDSVFLEPPVPYNEVQHVIAENDVVVFVESFDPRYCKVARLSFSTKITDYLASGKCIMAIGPEDSAPIEYLRENDAAIVASSKEEIEQKLQLLNNSSLVFEYKQKAFNCANQKHEKKVMQEKIYNVLTRLAYEC